MQRLVVTTLALIAALFGLAQLLRSAALDLAPPTPRQSATAAIAQAPSAGELAIDRDPSGQYVLPARVNGENLRFVVDTGADIVALTIEDAERLGLDLSPGDYQPILQTASGTGRGAVVRLDRIELGDEEFRDVEAVVAEGLRVNLLGRSLLTRLGRVEMHGDRMVIAGR